MNIWHLNCSDCWNSPSENKIRNINKTSCAITTSLHRKSKLRIHTRFALEMILLSGIRHRTIDTTRILSHSRQVGGVLFSKLIILHSVRHRTRFYIEIWSNWLTVCRRCNKVDFLEWKVYFLFIVGCILFIIMQVNSLFKDINMPSLRGNLGIIMFVIT